MKYIDTEKLIDEIERYIKHYEKLDRDDFKNGELYICQELLSFVKSLQQEQHEVDLDSKLSEFMSFYAYENSGEYPSTIDIARHFYELGLNTRK